MRRDWTTVRGRPSEAFPDAGFAIPASSIPFYASAGQVRIPIRCQLLPAWYRPVAQQGSKRMGAGKDAASI